MKFIAICQPLEPPAGWAAIHRRRISALDAKEQLVDKAEYIKSHSSWGWLKKWLLSLSNEKCWYCEAKSPRASFDVDHFRPKLGITVDLVALGGHPGYYWLAYEWTNFRVSCQRCNRPEKDDRGINRGKANEFPIENEAVRCRQPDDDKALEVPRFLDPCNRQDCELLAQGIDGEVKPAAAPKTWEYQRAEYTIRQLGLNCWASPEKRRGAWQTLALLIEHAGEAPGQELVDTVQSYLSSNQEYSSFFRSAIGIYRDKAWVQAIL